MRSRFEFMRAASKLFLAVASLSLAATAAFGQAQPAASPTPQPQARRAQRPFPPPQYIPPHDYDQRNIKLDLRFDWEREQAIGTATITLAAPVKDLRRAVRSSLNTTLRVKSFRCSWIALTSPAKN